MKTNGRFGVQKRARQKPGTPVRRQNLARPLSHLPCDHCFMKSNPKARSDLCTRRQVQFRRNRDVTHVFVRVSNRAPALARARALAPPVPFPAVMPSLQVGKNDRTTAALCFREAMRAWRSPLVSPKTRMALPSLSRPCTACFQKRSEDGLDLRLSSTLKQKSVHVCPRVKKLSRKP